MRGDKYWILLPSVASLLTQAKDIEANVHDIEYTGHLEQRIVGFTFNTDEGEIPFGILWENLFEDPMRDVFASPDKTEAFKQRLLESVAR